MAMSHYADDDTIATLERQAARLAELETIVRQQKAMLDKIAEAAGFELADTYSAASIIASLKESVQWKPIATAPWGKTILLWWRPVVSEKYPLPPETASPLSNNRYAETCVIGQIVPPDGGGGTPTQWWDGMRGEHKSIWHVTHWMPQLDAPWKQ